MPRKKVRFSYGNLQTFQILNFKNRSFWPGQGVVQIKPNGSGVSLHLVESRTKVIFAIACLESNWDQENQMESNWAWSIPVVGRVKDERSFCYSLLSKKNIISYENLRILRLANFKNRSLSRVKELSKSDQTRHGVSPV